MPELNKIHISEIATLYAVQDKPEAHYYDANEADKVIAEKNEELRCQKYKRCLAMAEWCDAKADAHAYSEDIRWYQKWHERWIEIADKFKE